MCFRGALALALLWGLTAEAAILYVDKDNTCPGSGTTGSPYCSVQNAFNVVNPGDTIRLRDSATPYDANPTLTRSGTNDTTGRIFIEPDVGHNPIQTYTGNGVLGAAWTMHGVNYVTVRNLTWDGAGIFTSRIGVAFETGGADVVGLQFIGNTIKNWGGNDTQASNVATRHEGLLISGEGASPTTPKVKGMLVQSNLFDNVRSRSVQITHSDNTIFELNEIKNANCARDGDNGVNVVGIHIFDNAWDFSSGNIVRNNLIHDFVPRASCGIANQGGYDNVAGVWCDVGSHSGEVSGNLIYNLDQGVTDVSTHASVGISIELDCRNWTVKNNIVHHVGYFGLSQRTSGSNNPATWPTQQNFFLNNTLYAIGGRVAGFGYGKFTFKNNIVYGNAQSAPLISPSWAAPGAYDIDFNQYFDTNNANHVGQWGSDQGAAITNLATWRTNCSCDANSTFGDPLFVTLGATPDLHLQATSPAKDTGTDLTSSGVTVDYDGQSRPQGAAFDRGADELLSGASGWVPTTLRLLR